MAWKFKENWRTCPGCGHSERILVIETADKYYQLSCGWCARLSQPYNAAEAFFGAWGGEDHRARLGAAMRLDGIEHQWRGKTVIDPPLIVSWHPDEVRVFEAA